MEEFWFWTSEAALNVLIDAITLGAQRHDVTLNFDRTLLLNLHSVFLHRVKDLKKKRKRKSFSF